MAETSYHLVVVKKTYSIFQFISIAKIFPEITETNYLALLRNRKTKSQNQLFHKSAKTTLFNYFL